MADRKVDELPFAQQCWQPEQGRPTKEQLDAMIEKVRACEAVLERRAQQFLDHPHPIVFLVYVSYEIGCYPRIGYEPLWVGSMPIAELAEEGGPVQRATAYAASVMVGTDDERLAVSQVLGPAIASIPARLRQLDQARPTEVWRYMSADGESATFGIGIRFAGGEDATVLCDVSRKSSHVVDIRFASGPPARSVSPGKLMLNVADSDSHQVPAAAAGRLLTAAIRRSEYDDLVPDYPWQRLRPLLDWALGLLPADSETPNCAEPQ